MITILNKNFSKEVKKELRKRRVLTPRVYVYYLIDNESKTGTLTIKFYEGTGIEKVTEISTLIEFTNAIRSYGIANGSVKRIVFNVQPTDMILDIVTQNHYLEAYKNAYYWYMQIVEDNVMKDTPYYISMIQFYNEKRTKSIQIKDVCFNGGEMIYIE